jgi:iron complex outermembrane recepter protein
MVFGIPVSRSRDLYDAFRCRKICKHPVVTRHTNNIGPLMSPLAVLFTMLMSEQAIAAAVPQSIDQNQSDHEHITVTSNRTPASKPTGQTAYSADRSTFAGTPATSVADMLATVPGVSMISNPGARDVAISIRGSDDRNTAGLKNIRVLEDGFPMTQPDGLARTDLIDPHAYDRVDVLQGPSSTVFGEFALDGVLAFHTRDGADIQGAEVGSVLGSFGQQNTYGSVGLTGTGYDLFVFGSDFRTNGFIANSQAETSTENGKLLIRLTPNDRLVVKFVHNVLDAATPLRLSLNQFASNPYQAGCRTLQSAGCASVTLLVNGAFGRTVSVSPEQAGLGRHDTRTIAGTRWEHDFSNETTWQTQFTWDERNLDQPTSNPTFIARYDSYETETSLTDHSLIAGLPLVSYAAANWNYMDFGGAYYNLEPSGGATIGAPTQFIAGHQWNAGARFQEELHFLPRWKAVLGLGGDYGDLGAVDRLATYSATGATQRLINANRFYFNLAPEAALVYAPNRDWTIQARVGTGYGVPSTNNLFVTSNGLPGNNTDLKAQTNVGVDLGTTWRPTPETRLQVTGFYEFFKNELVTQSAGVNLQSYTFNAPSSVHRGIEIGAESALLSRIVPGARALVSYTYDDQFYTNYTEVLSNASLSRRFDRDGKTIPGVVPHVLDARLIYDQPNGAFEGSGGFIEYNFRSSYGLDNAGLLAAPSYGLVNLELHYDPPARMPLLHRLHMFFEIENLLDHTYVASAANISDQLTSAGAEAGPMTLAAATGSILAGAPRSFYGGMSVRF